MKYFYTDYFIFPLDYIGVIKKEEVIYEWLLPLIVIIAGYWLGHGHLGIPVIKEMLSIIINMFAILIGFNAAAIIILITTDLSSNKILGAVSDRAILNVRITWFRFIYLNIAYSTITSLIILIIALLSLLFMPIVQTMALKYIRYAGEVVFYGILFGTLHVLLVTVRNTTNLYYVFFDRRATSKAKP
jgi:hypothetical protein